MGDRLNTSYFVVRISHIVFLRILVHEIRHAVYDIRPKLLMPRAYCPLVSNI